MKKYVILTYAGLVLTVLFTVRPIEFTVRMISDYGKMPKTILDWQQLWYATLYPEHWLLLGIGVTCLLIGVFYAKLNRFWIPLIVIGILSILSFSGVFLHTYKVDYLLRGDDAPETFSHNTMDNIKYLIPGIACIISGIILRKHQKHTVIIKSNNYS